MLVRFLILFFSLCLEMASLTRLEASNPCRSAFANMKAHISSRPRTTIVILFTTLAASFGLPKPAIQYWHSVNTPNFGASRGDQELAGPPSESNKAPNSIIVMARPEQDIPSEPRSRFESYRQKLNERRRKMEQEMGVPEGTYQLKAPQWDEIFSNPGLSEDPSLTSQEKYKSSNALTLSRELNEWRFGQSLEEQAKSLPQVLKVLKILQSASEIAPASTTSLGNHINPHSDMTEITAKAVAEFAASLPDPDDLGPAARENFYHFDELIQELQVVDSSPETSELLSELWAQQLYYSGTISLPSGFQRNHILKTRPDGSTQKCRTVSYRDNRYHWTGNIFESTDHQPARVEFDTSAH